MSSDFHDEKGAYVSRPFPFLLIFSIPGEFSTLDNGAGSHVSIPSEFSLATC